MDSVVIYMQPDCPDCTNVKTFLDNFGVSYVEKDISADIAALDDFRRLGLPATPVTVVGECSILGFSRRALAQALRLSPQS